VLSAESVLDLMRERFSALVSYGTAVVFLSLLFFLFFLIGAACLSFGLYYGWYAKILWEMGIYGIVSPSQITNLHCTATSFEVRSVALIQNCVIENIAYSCFAYFCVGSILFFTFGYLKYRNPLRGTLIGIQGSSGVLLLFSVLVYFGDRRFWNEGVTQLQTAFFGISPEALTNADLFTMSLAVFSLSTFCYYGFFKYRRYLTKWTRLSTRIL
jgi:hypothetical protein